MQIPLEVSARRLDLTPALEAELRERAGKLDHLYTRLTSCRIALERPSFHHNEGGPYRVRLDLTVPGGELVANKEAETLDAALNDAFEAAERQIKDFVERRRGMIKAGPSARHGTVLRLFRDQGFGFLTDEDGSEIYFHRNAVLDPGFERLEVGATVRYAVEQGFEGPQATTVEAA